MKYIPYTLLLAFILLSSFHIEDKKTLIGHWKRDGYSEACKCYNYIKVPTLKERQLGYHFQRNGKVKATLCTDICGCMAKTFKGEWSLDGEKLDLKIKNRSSSTITLKVVNKDKIQLHFD